MHVLGLHIDGKTLKVALLRKDKKKVEIELLRTFLLEEGSSPVKVLYILAPILSGKEITLVTGLDSWEMIVREMNFKLTRKREILSILPFQLESALPYSMEELILLPFFYPGQEKSTDTLLFATTQALLNEHLTRFCEFEIDPEQVSCTPAALGRLAQHLFVDHPSFFFFHLGMQKSSYGLILNKKLDTSQTLTIGLQDFLNALEKDFPEKTKDELNEIAIELDLLTLDTSIYPHLSQLMLQFQRDMDRILSFLKKKPEAQAVHQLMVTGNFPPFHKFNDYLEKHLSPSISILSISAFQQYDFPTLQSYAVPIGLSLDALFQDSQSLQFRQETFICPKQKKSRTRSALIYLASCCTLAAAMCTFTMIYEKKREKEISEKLMAYLPGAASQVTLNAEDLQRELLAWEKEINKEKKSFPYLPSVPRVSDVLAWISSHPSLISRNEGKDNIEIKRFNYVLTKYPKLGATSESYQAKVELDFTSSSPRLAREFHDALLKGDAIVNSKSEIGWSVQQNTYHTVFFLNQIHRGASP